MASDQPAVAQAFASTKVSHVASTTHRQPDDAALAAAGLDPGAVRFSIGLEDGEDLIADVHQALDALGGAGRGGGDPPGPPASRRLGGNTPPARLPSPVRGRAGAEDFGGIREERA